MNPHLPAPADSHPPWWRRRFPMLVLRFGLSIALMVLLFAQMGDIDTDELIPEWHRDTFLWASAAFALTLTAFVMAALRWQRVLEALDVHMPLPRLFSHHMAGQFLSNFVPTTVGGDVLRVSRLTRDTRNGPIAFTSVVFERLSGWLVLPLLTFIGFAVNPGLTHLGTATKVPLVIAFATLLGLVLVLVVLGHGRTGSGLDGRDGLLRFANSVHLGIAKFRAHPRAARQVLFSALAYQFVLLLAAGCAVEALQIDRVGLTSLMAFLPAVLIIQVLPLGIGGLGIREGALVVFLGGMGVSDEQSVALGLAIYVLTLAASLIGFPLLLFGGRARSPQGAGDAPVAV